jgi:hypothetical protein
VEDLGTLWGMRDSSIGMRSVHGAVQAQLLRAPPRDDVRRTLVEELERAGGRAPEGAILRIVAAEKGLATTYEIRRAVDMLAAHGRLERLRVEPPKSPSETKEKDGAPPRGIENIRMPLPVDRLTTAQRQWTGFDLRLTRATEPLPDDLEEIADGERGVRQRGDLTMRLALRAAKDPMAARRERWRRQDEALEAECQRIDCKESMGYDMRSHDDAGLGPHQIAAIDRATHSLSAIAQTFRLVIRRFYFEQRDDVLGVAEYTTLALEAARLARAPTVPTVIRQRWEDDAWMGQLTEASECLVTDASVAYKDARRLVKSS